MIVPVAAPVLVRLFTYVREHCDTALGAPASGGTHIGGGRCGRVDNDEHVVVFSKGSQVPRAITGGLESVGKRHVLQPAAGFGVDDTEDNGIGGFAVDVGGHNEVAVTGIEIHFIA